MEVLIRCAALAVFSAMIALVLRRFNPEISFALSAVTLTVILLACGVLLEKLLSSAREVFRIFGESPAELQPILKCIGIAAVSRITSDLCKDASQAALASAVETAATFCAAAVAMPMILGLLTTIAGIL